VSHDRALLDAVAERTVAIEDEALHSYDGGWADLVRTRSEAREPAPAPAESPRERKPRAPKQKPERRRPSELERSEARVAELERRVATLEAKLAQDWTDMDVLTAHRAARDELQVELTRWEELFEAAQPETPTPG